MTYSYTKLNLIKNRQTGAKHKFSWDDIDDFYNMCFLLGIYYL